MTNIWEKRFRKNNKSAYELGKELNIGEEKVKEIIRGEREVPTNDVDRVYGAFTNKGPNKLSSTERALMEKYFNDNDIQELKKEFGYHSLEELSKAMNVGVSTMYYFRGDKMKALSDKLLKKAYDFFQDGFNKKVVKKKRDNGKGKYKVIYWEDLKPEVQEWYENTDLKELRREKKLTGKKLIKKLGFDNGYYTILCGFENKTKRKTKNCLLLQQLYNYYNGLELINLKAGEEDYNNINTPVFEHKDVEPKEETIIKAEAIKNDDAIDAIRYYIENKKEERKSTINTDAKEYVTIETYTALLKEVERYRYLIDKLIENENKKER